MIYQDRGMLAERVSTITAYEQRGESAEVVVEASATYRQHVNGKVLFARPEIMGHPDAMGLTATLRAAQTVGG